MNVTAPAEAAVNMKIDYDVEKLTKRIMFNLYTNSLLSHGLTTYGCSVRLNISCHRILFV